MSATVRYPLKMAYSLRLMRADDILRIIDINIDKFTETFDQRFYSKYLACWPELCIAAETFDGCIAGYIIGKVEGEGTKWHSHVTALSVSAECRMCGLAHDLMACFEETSEHGYKCRFVDLYVRKGNTPAVSFYRNLGYKTWRTEEQYYADAEDALDMRKPLLSNDPKRLSLKGAEEK